MISKRYIYFFIAVFLLLSIVSLTKTERRIFLWEDHDIALNIVNEGEFYYESDGAKNHTFQFPIYASCLAVIYTFFGSFPDSAILLNLLIHVFSGWIFLLLFKLLLDFLKPTLEETIKQKIVFISLIVFLFHPVLLVYCMNHVHPLMLNILSLFSGLYFSLRFALDPNRRNLVLAGIIIGVAMLDRATVVLTLIPAAIILWQKISFIEAFKKMSLVGLISFLIISPWLIRNYRVDGIIGFESSAAKNIWKGILYDSDGSNYLLSGKNYYSALTNEEKLGLGKMTALGQRDFFRDKYNEILRNDPGHVMKMFFLKLKNFWWFRSGAGTEWGTWQKALPVYKILYGISLLFIIYFLFKDFKNGIILLSFPIALSILQAYFYVETRHRVAIEPFLFFLAILSSFQFYKDYFSQKPKRMES